MEELIWKNVLPRLDSLEAELMELREVTWPVCQGARDRERGGPFSNLIAKGRFFLFLSIEEMRKLLHRKAVHMGVCTTLIDEELRQILVVEPRAGKGPMHAQPHYLVDDQIP
jgi:hypothetical protein